MLQPLESKPPPYFITSNWLFHQKLKLWSKEGVLALLYISYKWLTGAGELSSLLPGWFFQRFVALSHFLPHNFVSSFIMGCWIFMCYSHLWANIQDTESVWSKITRHVKFAFSHACEIPISFRRKSASLISPTTALLKLFPPPALIIVLIADEGKVSLHPK